MLQRTTNGVVFVKDKHPVLLCCRASPLLPQPKHTVETARIQAALLRAPISKEK